MGTFVCWRLPSACFNEHPGSLISRGALKPADTAHSSRFICEQKTLFWNHYKKSVKAVHESKNSWFVLTVWCTPCDSDYVALLRHPSVSICTSVSVPCEEPVLPSTTWKHCTSQPICFQCNPIFYFSLGPGKIACLFAWRLARTNGWSSRAGVTLSIHSARL